MNVKADKLMEFAKTLEGQVLETGSGKSQFTVRVTKNGMEYTPLSTGKVRQQSDNYIRRICEQFSLTNSFVRRDYSYTAHGSYALAIIGRYINRKQ